MLIVLVEIIEVAASRPKVFTTNDRSTYSNVAFSLLGQVLERATGKSYSEVIASSILQPLGMNHTRASKPKDSLGVIPWGPNDWAQDLGDDIPYVYFQRIFCSSADLNTSSGGLYSTANDFSKYLQSILSSKLLPRATTNAWMKPHSWTSGTNSAYGMPWEMIRTSKLTPDGRAIDIVTKGGSLTAYYSLIAMVPEFGLGATILVAGSNPAVGDLSERLIAQLIPAVEELMRREVRAQYAGSWSHWDEESHSFNTNWSLNLQVDDVGPGIKVVDWVSNGTDFLPIYGSFKRMGKESGNWQARLIPTGVYSGPNEDGVEFEKWRLTAIPEKSAESENKVFDDFCMTDVDALMYDGFPVEEFTIVKEEKEASKLFISGLRTKLQKRQDGSTTRETQKKASFLDSNGDQVPLIFG